MANDHTDPVADAVTVGVPTPEMNGTTTDGIAERDPIREQFRLRAQCAKLLHWCRDLVDAEGSKGVLPPETEREVRETPPEMTSDEALAALRVISLGEPLPSETRPVPGGVAALAAQRDRLRKVFFALHDAALGRDDVTDEYFQELVEERPSTTIGDVVARFQRELGANP